MTPREEIDERTRARPGPAVGSSVRGTYVPGLASESQDRQRRRIIRPQGPLHLIPEEDEAVDKERVGEELYPIHTILVGRKVPTRG